MRRITHSRPPRIFIFSAAILLALSSLLLTTLAAPNITRAITIGWDPSLSANVVGYRLHYGQQSGSYSHTLDVGNRTTSDVTNLVEGTTYYFAVTAYTAAGDESFSSEEFHYMPNPALLLNLSTRAMVETGDRVMIAGFIVGGSGRKKLIVRVLGPSLVAVGLNGVLDDPTLEIRGSDGLVIANDNWRDGFPDELNAVGLAPANDVEPAIVAALNPGSYTAIVRGKGNSTGLVLLEVYDGGTVGD